MNRPFGSSVFCMLSFVLVLTAFSLPASADNITVDGTGIISGQLPTIITAFANQAGTDVYPAALSSDFYTFTYFDTGSDQVAVGSDDAFLGLSEGTTTNIRVNGLSSINDATLLAPIGTDTSASGGTYGTPQAEVTGVAVSAPAGLEPTLIGAPVANEVIATIDYGTTITKGPYNFSGCPVGGCFADGPDINFVDTVPYAPSIQVDLARFGTPDSSSHTEGYRYYMLGTSLNDGAFSVGSDTSGNNGRFLYDTGTNVTLITNALATSLGLSLTSGFDITNFDVGGNPLNGYYLDSIIMSGTGGMYTVNNAPVLIAGPSLGGSADAIIGSNLFSFSNTPLIFDGPNDWLGIGESTTPTIPEPSTWLLLASGLFGIACLARKRR